MAPNFFLTKDEIEVYCHLVLFGKILGGKRSYLKDVREESHPNLFQLKVVYSVEVWHGMLDGLAGWSDRTRGRRVGRVVLLLFWWGHTSCHVGVNPPLPLFLGRRGWGAVEVDFGHIWTTRSLGLRLAVAVIKVSWLTPDYDLIQANSSRGFG